MKDEKLTPHQERVAAEIAAWSAWQRETLLPLMKAAKTAHRHHVSFHDFLEHAAGAYRGCDPMDLPQRARSPRTSP